MNARTVEPEWLDELPPTDPRAQRSRRDLRRINAWMGNARFIAHALRSSPPAHIVELGAGDGVFLLALARHLPPARATLVDRQPLVTAATRAALIARGWEVRPVVADVFDWLESASVDGSVAIVANLFLHQFEDVRLRCLFALVASRAAALVACEPARHAMAMTGVDLLWLIGCNDVTRHDARLSVRAGFRTGELSALWPDLAAWDLHEWPAGLFSHVFVARRR